MKADTLSRVGTKRFPGESVDRNFLIKKMNYLARRRSTLELDQMLTRIVERLDWNEFGERDLLELHKILELDDLLIQNALLKRLPAPPGANPDMWEKMLRRL